MGSKGSLVALAILFLPLLINAQQTPSGFTVVSNPQGAEVMLKGDVTIAGVTPVNFAQPPEGRYQVKLTKYGYETYKTSIYLQPGTPMSLTIQLKSKTRFKALSRSLFIPGWGQSYTDQKFKGGVFLFLAAGAVASFLAYDADYDDKVDRYKGLLNEYQQASTYEEKEKLYSRVATARKDAYDAESARRITIGATVAVWSLSLIDLFLFFPEETGSLSVNSLSIRPDMEQGGAQIVLTHRF